jgi:glyoxylase-like metal-dependent hydrolase (beta-lactamase superfamily II)
MIMGENPNEWKSQSVGADVFVEHVDPPCCSNAAGTKPTGVDRAVSAAQSGRKHLLRRQQRTRGFSDHHAADILINSNLVSSVPQIQASIEKLGFHLSDVKILLISHAHFDHCAGSAKLKELTGAGYMVMDADVPVVESGGKRDFQYGGSKGSWYPATKVDRVLHDGDQVRLGDTVLVAHLTPGHTKGTTTWTMKVSDGGKIREVVIVGSPNVNPGYKLVHNAAYPNIAQD